jgi:hypothetical protein
VVTPNAKFDTLTHMADEKHPGHSGQSGGAGQNWLFGLDKLTSPTFDFLGIKLRDKLRAWLNQKARERALLRRFEKDFLYRHLDLLNYGNDQYAAMLANVGGIMLERQLVYIAPLVRSAVIEHKIPPDRAFDCIMNGFQHESLMPTLTGGELILYSAAASVFDSLLVAQVAQMVFQFAHIPSGVHLENPKVSDTDIEQLMQDEATLHSVSDGMDPAGTEVAKCFAKILCEAYGQPFDEKAFDARVASADRQISAGSSELTPEG